MMGAVGIAQCADGLSGVSGNLWEASMNTEGSLCAFLPIFGYKIIEGRFYGNYRTRAESIR